MIKQFIFALLAVSSLGGCGASSSLSSRHANAVEIGSTAMMTERVIPAGQFSLTAWERVTKQDTPVNLYIEGDGLAWLDAHTKSMNPTPPDPLTLRLAAADRAENVIYIARPCQYTGMSGGGFCSDIYWTTGRTAPEVIQAFQQALNNIKHRYNVSGFNLIGYSGGASVAALAAAGRTDVLSLRTVAGNTDYTAFTNYHRVSPMDGSVNPVTVAAKLANLPQMHFIGGDDEIVPGVVFDSWEQASGSPTCVQSAIVPDVSHEKGWAERWPELLKTPVECK